MTISVSGLTVYPVKSTAGCALQRTEIEPRGLRDDRRWLVVDEQGRFLTGRDEPRLLTVRATVDGDALRLNGPRLDELVIDDARGAGEPIDVEIWGDRVRAVTVSRRADAWLDRLLDRPHRLVYMPADAERAVDPEFAAPGDVVSFADGYPLLLTSDESLQDLDARTPIATAMARFRPNVTVSGAPAYAEDSWRRLRIGAVELDAAKLCDRCVMTTIDPLTASAHPGREPLRTLAGYRSDPARGILFGVNLIPRGAGTVAVGDTVEILD